MGKVYYIKDKKKFDEAFDAVAIPLRKTEKPKKPLKNPLCRGV